MPRLSKKQNKSGSSSFIREHTVAPTTKYAAVVPTIANRVSEQH